MRPSRRRVPRTLLPLITAAVGCSVPRTPLTANPSPPFESAPVVSVGHGRVALMRLDEAGVVRHWLEVRPVGDSSVIGWRIEYADAELGASGRIVHVVVAARVHGRAEIGGRSASWRIRVEQAGIEAERWRVPRTSERDRAALTRAHELTVEVLGSDACSAELLAAELGLDVALGGRGSRASRLLGCE